MSPALTYCPPTVTRPSNASAASGSSPSPTLLDVERMWDAPVVPEPKRPRISPYAAPILLSAASPPSGTSPSAPGCIVLGRLAWHAARAVIGGGQ
jgi:hypothetical protein